MARGGHGGNAAQLDEAVSPGGRGHGRCCGSRRHGGGVGRGALVEPAVVVALLRENGHGYDLRKSVAEIMDDLVPVDAGGLYRVLRRLEDEGYVSSAWIEGDSGPQRREYRLTARAHELAEDWSEHLRERERLAGLLAEALEDGMRGSGQD